MLFKKEQKDNIKDNTYTFSDALDFLNSGYGIQSLHSDRLYRLIGGILVKFNHYDKMYYKEKAIHFKDIQGEWLVLD